MKFVVNNPVELVSVLNDLTNKNTWPLNIEATKQGDTGKWSMARLWRAWMQTTADFMATNGVTMPLMIDKSGKPYGKRPFNKDDAHELFTKQHLGCDSEGIRLSWAKDDHDEMRAATKGERFNAMLRHNIWCTERGISLFNPRDGEYFKLNEEQNQ